MAYVYRHVREDLEEVFYVGVSAKSDLNFTRANSFSKRNPQWQEIFNKTNITIDILVDDLTLEEARKKEREFISLYGRKDKNNGTLINLTDGGEICIGYRHTDAAKKILREKNLGRKRTKESILKASNKLKGQKRTEEQRKRISKSLEGRVLPRESIEKMRKKKLLPYNVEKSRNQPNCVKVFCISNNTVYRSAAEAARVLNLNRTGVSLCCLGLRNHTNNLKFEYYKNQK